MKVIVSGSSEYGEMPRAEIDAALKEAKWRPKMLVLSGDRNGVCEVARQWAMHRGEIPFLTVPARYRHVTDRAGPRRDIQMCKIANALLIIRRTQENKEAMKTAHNLEKIMKKLGKPVHVREV